MPLVLNGTTGVQDNSGAFVASTAVASTSGTSIDFTSIPSWVKRVTIMFVGVSTNGTSDRMVRIGAGSVDTTGYVGTGASYWTGSSAVSSITVGFNLGYTGLTYAAGLESGTIVLNLVGSNTWVATVNISSIGGAVTYSSTMGGYKTLSGALDRVRITTVGGTDTFDAGSINITYE
jgi:hypothetical protein